MEVLQILGLWDQEIDSWFTNHKPLIPTLNTIKQHTIKHTLLNQLSITKQIFLNIFHFPSTTTDTDSINDMTLTYTKLNK